MKRHLAHYFATAFFLLFPVIVSAQADPQGDPAAGILPFSTHVNGPVDSLDIATSNIVIKIPVRSKTGAIPFDYALVSNSHAYPAPSPTNAPPPPPGTIPPIFIPTAFRGEGMGVLGAALHSSLNGTMQQCGDSDQYNDPQLVWSVIDSTGAHHPLSLDYWTDWDGCNTLWQGAVTTDGSGYTVSFVSQSGNVVAGGNIFDRAGNEEPWTALSMVDPDGNQVVGNYGAGSVLNYNDTLLPTGTPVLSVISADQYQYTDAAGGTQSVQVNTSPQFVATNFGCSSALDIQPSDTPLNLPSSITVPGGGAYTFTYEPTPGYAGYVTGRIAKITLPSGGYVAYTYWGSGGGGSNGYNCSEHTVPTMTRTVADNNGNVRYLDLCQRYRLHRDCHRNRPSR